MDLDTLKDDIRKGELDHGIYGIMLINDLKDHFVSIDTDIGFLARIFRYIFSTCDTCSTGGCTACTNGCSNASCSNVACFSAQCSGGPCSQGCVVSCSNSTSHT